MSFGLLAWDGDGRVVLQEDGTYLRLVDAFNPFSVGVPGSKQYAAGLDLQFSVQQGNSRILNVTISPNNLLSWSYADQFSWPEYSAAASILVVTV